MHEFIEFFFELWREHIILVTIAILVVLNCLVQILKGKDMFD